MASIKYQVINAIDSAFRTGGHDKHSAKQNEGTQNTIYSYKERENLMDTGIQLAEYCKSEFGVKQVKNITSKMVSSFLNNKAQTCNQTTLGQYGSRLNKLGNLINNRYQTANVSWKVPVPVSQVRQGKLRDVPMSKEDYMAVLKYAKDAECKSKAPIAIELSGRFGLRVSETCKLQPRDLDFNNLKLHIHESKGGRSRDLDISKEDVPFLKSIISNKEPTQKILNIKEDSVNRWLGRAMDKLGITKYNTAKTGVHSVRKMAATERYHTNLKNGMSERDAEKDVSVWLGHGEDRQDVIRNYIYK